MNTTRSTLYAATAALAIGIALGGGAGVAATASAPPSPAVPDCATITHDYAHGTADNLERVIQVCLDAGGDAVSMGDQPSALLLCRLREIENRPWTADTIDRRLAACGSLVR